MINNKKNILAISGSIRNESSNMQLIKAIEKLSQDSLQIEIYNDLEKLPYFNPSGDSNLPVIVEEFLKKIEEADGVLICTPEYVFSLPGLLKNAIEWTVSTIVFSDKPVALITASGLGEKAYESLQLIMKTVGAKFNDQSQLLIQGARAKLSTHGEIIHTETLNKVKQLITSFTETMSN